MGLGEKGATSAEVAKHTNIGTSSVYAVLTKHDGTFSKGTDGLWRLKV